VTDKGITFEHLENSLMVDHSAGAHLQG